MSQEQVQKQKARSEAQEVEAIEAKDVQNEKLDQTTKETLEDIQEALEDFADDQLLGEIDDLLEVNAEEFVAGYIQQGGE